MEIQVWRKRVNEKELLVIRKLEGTRAVKRQNLIGQRRKSLRLRDDASEKLHVVLTDVVSYKRTVEGSWVVKLKDGEKEEACRWLQVR